MNKTKEFLRLLPKGRIASWVQYGAALVLGWVVLRLWSGPDEMWADVRGWIAVAVLWLIIVAARVIWVYSGQARQSDPLTDATRRLFVRSGAGVLAILAGGGGVVFGRRIQGEEAREFAPALELQGRYILNKRLVLEELTDSRNPRIQDKVFEGCDIQGPAIIYIFGSGGIWDCQFEARQFPGKDTALVPDRMFIESDRPLAGSVIVENCEFRKCYFHHVGISGTKALLDFIRSRSPGAGD